MSRHEGVEGEVVIPSVRRLHHDASSSSGFHRRQHLASSIRDILGRVRGEAYQDFGMKDLIRSLSRGPQHGEAADPVSGNHPHRPDDGRDFSSDRSRTRGNGESVGARGAMKYVLITAARNEEELIEGTLHSVVSQTNLPNAGSSLMTVPRIEPPRIAEQYAAATVDRSSAMSKTVQPKFCRQGQGGQCGVGADALTRLRSGGNLDADVTFAPDYMAFLIEKFDQDPELGVVGTPFTQEGRIRFQQGQF